MIPLGPGTSEKRKRAVAGPRWPWVLAVLNARCAWCDRELRECYCVDNPRVPRAGPEPDIATYIAACPSGPGLLRAGAMQVRRVPRRDAGYRRTYRANLRKRGVCTRCQRPTERYLCDKCHADTSTTARRGAISASRRDAASDVPTGPNRGKRCAGSVSRRGRAGAGAAGRGLCCLIRRARFPSRSWPTVPAPAALRLSGLVLGFRNQEAAVFAPIAVHCRDPVPPVIVSPHRLPPQR